MLDARGRDIGAPEVRKVYLPSAPESVARTRADFERALSRLYREINGYPTEVTINWPGEEAK